MGTQNGRPPAGAYPTVPEAAAIIGVPARELESISGIITGRGGSPKDRVAPWVALKLSERFGKKGLWEVTRGLTEVASRAGAAAAREVEEEARGYVRELPSRSHGRVEFFLSEAREILPAGAYAEVEKAAGFIAPLPPSPGTALLDIIRKYEGSEETTRASRPTGGAGIFK